MYLQIVRNCAFITGVHSNFTVILDAELKYSDQYSQIIRWQYRINLRQKLQPFKVCSYSTLFDVRCVTVIKIYSIQLQQDYGCALRLSCLLFQYMLPLLSHGITPMTGHGLRQMQHRTANKAEFEHTFILQCHPTIWGYCHIVQILPQILPKSRFVISCQSNQIYQRYKIHISKKEVFLC